VRIGIRPKSKGGSTDEKATYYTLRFRICSNRIGPEFRGKSNTAIQSVPRWQMDRGKGAIQSVPGWQVDERKITVLSARRDLQEKTAVQSVPGWQVGKINSHEQGNIVRPNMLR